VMPSAASLGRTAGEAVTSTEDAGATAITDTAETAARQPPAAAAKNAGQPETPAPEAGGWGGGTAIRSPSGRWQIKLGPGADVRPIGAGTGAANMNDPAQFAEEGAPTLLRVMAESFQDSADSVEQVSTAGHEVLPAIPVIPSATVGSGLIATMLGTVLVRAVARGVGGVLSRVGG
jgi:hypothetical protein